MKNALGLHPSSEGTSKKPMKEIHWAWKAEDAYRKAQVEEDAGTKQVRIVKMRQVPWGAYYYSVQVPTKKFDEKKLKKFMRD